MHKKLGISSFYGIHGTAMADLWYSYGAHMAPKNLGNRTICQPTSTLVPGHTTQARYEV